MIDVFQFQFCARYLDITLDLQTLLPPLLRKAKALVDLTEPPLPIEGCEDCQMVNGLVSWLSLPQKRYQIID